MNRRFALFIAVSLIPNVGAQPAPNNGEMQMTSAGFLAVSTPAGFLRVEGPIDVVFTPGGKEFGTTGSFIYITPVRIGKGTRFKSLDAFVADDVKRFRKQYKKSAAQEESAVELPFDGRKAPSWTFRSGESKNAFERLVFLQDAEKLVWLLVLSATSAAEFEQTVPVFLDFVRTYKGSIILGKP